MMKRLLLFFTFSVSLVVLYAQPSDSLVAQMLHDKNINISEGNNVRLLMSGYAKFDDLFAEIEKANIIATIVDGEEVYKA